MYLQWHCVSIAKGCCNKCHCSAALRKDLGMVLRHCKMVSQWFCSNARGLAMVCWYCEGVSQYYAQGCCTRGIYDCKRVRNTNCSIAKRSRNRFRVLRKGVTMVSLHCEGCLHWLLSMLNIVTMFGLSGSSFL